MKRRVRQSFKGLWQSFDEANFGTDRTLNLRESLPSAIEARARAEAWLRMKQVMQADEVLVITGRGNQSPNGIGVVREAIMALMPSLAGELWVDHEPNGVRQARVTGSRRIARPVLRVDL